MAGELHGHEKICYRRQRDRKVLDIGPEQFHRQILRSHFHSLRGDPYLHEYEGHKKISAAKNMTVFTYIINQRTYYGCKNDRDPQVWNKFVADSFSPFPFLLFK
jgi:hypothetical protein